MKRQIRKHMKLGEAIEVVSKLARNDYETGVVMADMLNRGLIKLSGPLRHYRIVSR